MIASYQLIINVIADYIEIVMLSIGMIVFWHRSKCRQMQLALNWMRANYARTAFSKAA